MADDKLIADVANVIAHGVNTEGGAPGWSKATALGILSNPALIKRMAEGVGFEVKEKPARYVVAEADAAVFVRDGLTAYISIASVSKFPDPEFALRHCRQMADELNQKERG